MKILSFSQLKTAEQIAVSSGTNTFPGLMKKAGESAAREIMKKYDILGKSVNIVCGSGNNGGDGLVVAGILHSEGANVTVSAPFGLPSTDTARGFYDCINNIGVVDNVDVSADITVDALFGIGLNRPPKDTAEKVIKDMNSAKGIKIALDIPSGVYCDGGFGGIAFKADFTITFIAFKSCLLLPDTSSFCGETVLCDIGIDPDDYSFKTIDKPNFIVRDKNSHKGSFGTGFMICGSYGMCGAEILAAKAAMRCGIGIVKAIVCDKNYTAFTVSVPEAVTVPVETSETGAPVVYDKNLFSGLSSSNACLIGCGLGRSDDSVRLVKRTLELSEIPVVVDADGINVLLKDINILSRTKAPIIITPHPAEMARLCETTVSDIEHNRIKYARNFAVKYGCTVVLKGSNTIVSSEKGELYFNITGNPGMATAGSGDVLSGIILSLLAQGCDPLSAACYGVYIHGAAGDFAAEHLGERYMNSSDIIEGLKNI